MIIELSYEVCGISPPKVTASSMPTGDSNNMEIEMLKKEIWEIKATSAADKPQKGLIIAEIAELKQDSMTAAFPEDKKRIRVDYQDKEAWKNSSDSQRQEACIIIPMGGSLFSLPREARNIPLG
jgi:hypothetical protein